MQIVVQLSYKLRLPIAREHDCNGDYIRLLIGGVMCQDPSLHSRFDVTARGSLGMQIGSTIRNKRETVLKFILRSLNIYQASLINVI